MATTITHFLASGVAAGISTVSFFHPFLRLQSLLCSTFVVMLCTHVFQLVCKKQPVFQSSLVPSRPFQSCPVLLSVFPVLLCTTFISLLRVQPFETGSSSLVYCCQFSLELVTNFGVPLGSVRGFVGFHRVSIVLMTLSSVVQLKGLLSS